MNPWERALIENLGAETRKLRRYSERRFRHGTKAKAFAWTALAVYIAVATVVLTGVLR